MRKTQNPLTDYQVLRLYVYLITTQSAVCASCVSPVKKDYWEYEGDVYRQALPFSTHSYG